MSTQRPEQPGQPEREGSRDRREPAGEPPRPDDEALAERTEANGPLPA